MPADGCVHNKVCCLWDARDKRQIPLLDGAPTKLRMHMPRRLQRLAKDDHTCMRITLRSVRLSELHQHLMELD